jgi:hypothetical protein
MDREGSSAGVGLTLCAVSAISVRGAKSWSCVCGPCALMCMAGAKDSWTRG